MNRFIKLLMGGIGRAVGEYAGSRIGPSIDVAPARDVYHRVFDPTGETAGQSRMATDALSALSGLLTGVEPGYLNRSNPIMDKINAVASMSGASGGMGGQITPERYAAAREMARQADRQYADEMAANFGVRGRYLENERAWGQMGRGVLARNQAVNQAMDQWRKSQSQAGRKPSETEAIRQRRSIASRFPNYADAIRYSIMTRPELYAAAGTGFEVRPGSAEMPAGMSAAPYPKGVADYPYIR